MAEVDQLHSRAESLADEFKRGGESGCIDEAIDLGRQALELCPLGHSKRSTSLIWVSNHLNTRYSRLGRIEDVSKAITLGREALLLHPPGHPNRSTSLNNLGLHLSTRYKRLGALDDLDEAIALDREALLLRPPGHPDRSKSLNNLGARLSTRYNRLGALDDLDEAIALNCEALLLCPPGHPVRSMSLNNLGGDLSTRYNRLGALDDLDEAIALGREALLLHPPGHPDRSMSLNNLGLYLSTRYNRLGALDDLDEAIVLDREALLLRPPGHPDRSESLNNLGVHLSTRYKRLGALDDLDEAIALDREALLLRPPGHPYRSSSLNNLGVHLSTRYDRLGALDDLDEAIALEREALLFRPPGHPDRSSSLNNLGVDLSTRYDRLGALDDLDEAIALDREALLLCPPGHPLHPWSLHSLASTLHTRFTKLRKHSDFNEFFRFYIQLQNVQQITSLDHFSSVRAWITAAEDFKHSSTMFAYQTALRLLIHHLATLPSLPRHLANVKSLTSMLAADAFSAGIRNYAPARAVELLEQGRGVFWSQLTRLHSSLDDVVASGSEGKTLADKFNRLTLLIRDATNSPGSDQHNKLSSLNVALQGVIAEIRQLPRLSRFLLPPTFSDLQLAATGGPVIIVNASKYTCDALVVLLDQDPIHVPLRAVTKQDVQEMSTRLRTLTVRAKSGDVAKDIGLLLRELWDKVVSPVVDILRTIHPLQSRIWWCPTAEITSLPLHAAGPYRPGEQNLSDLYVSSYTPTLSALVRARRCVQPEPRGQTTHEHPIPTSPSPISVTNPKEDRNREGLISPIFSRIRSRRYGSQHTKVPKIDFSSALRSLFRGKQSNILNTTEMQTDATVAIGQADTSESDLVSVVPGRNDILVGSVGPPKVGTQQIHFVAIGQATASGESELKSVSSELTDIGHLVDGVATFTRVEGAESCISRVVKELGKNEWVHLACHGIPNEEQPFDSAFALYDGHFTIERIIKCELKNPEFAYLSACHTTVGDKESPDEVIHLAAAMQFVGFRSVIGTMWAVDDGETNKITSTFYKHLIDEMGHLDYTRAAVALHRTMKDLQGKVPGDQRILYVHIGA